MPFPYSAAHTGKLLLSFLLLPAIELMGKASPWCTGGKGESQRLEKTRLKIPFYPMTPGQK